MNDTITKKEMTSIIRQIKTQQMDVLTEMRFNIMKILTVSEACFKDFNGIDKEMVSAIESVILIADKREDGEDE